MDVDIFNVIGFLKKKHYLVTCPGVDGYILVDEPSVSTMLGEIKQASGDDITKHQFFDLLERSRVVLPTKLAGSNVRSKIGNLKKTRFVALQDYDY